MRLLHRLLLPCLAVTLCLLPLLVGPGAAAAPTPTPTPPPASTADPKVGSRSAAPADEPTISGGTELDPAYAEPARTTPETTPEPSPEPSGTETEAILAAEATPLAPATPRAIWDDAVGGKWLGLGGAGGWLGQPQMALGCGLRDGGCFQHFAGGSIYWTPGAGAWAVRGAIRARWGAGGWELGRLGYPTSDEFCGLRGGGCGQRFAGGYIYWTPGTGARAVWGAIRVAYEGSRWETGPLGYPVSDEFCGLIQSGCGQRFQSGIIYWSPGAGPHPVRGVILQGYARQGYERGALGYPRAAEAPARNGSIVQQFQNGQLNFSLATGQLNLPNGGYQDHDAVPCGAGLWCKNGYRYSPRGFAYRNCTDFVAWRRGMVWSQINGRGDGHARGWRQGWIDRGRTVSTVPRVGAIAWWGSYGNGYGHVAVVTGVNPDGSVTVEHYNFDPPGGYSVGRNMRAEAYLY